MTRRGAQRRAVALLLLALLPAAPATASDDAAAWTALGSGGHVLLLRHAATEPGVGDPPGFRLGDCATQRNLSPEGRAQARRLGERLAAHQVAVGPVLSSRWCRCLDTAAAAFGRVEPWPALDSFFGEPANGEGPTRELRQRAGSWRGPGTLVLVTHQVNVTAATGVVPAMGEALVLAPRGGDRFDVVGRITP